MSELKPKAKPLTWTEKVIAGYKEGMSDVEVCREMDWTMKTFNESYSHNEGFRKLIDYGRMLSNAWWMEQGRKNLWDKTFSVALWNFNMKNRFGWADKSEVKGEGIVDGATNLDDLRTRLHKALPKVLAQYAPELSDAQLLSKIKADNTTNETN